MGLIKLAMIGGAGYYVATHLKNKKEGRCQRSNDRYDGQRGMTEDNYANSYPSGTRNMTGEKYGGPYNNGGTPPAYPVDHPNQLPSYPNEKQGQSPQYQQMNFTQPSHPYYAGNAAYDNEQRGATKSLTNGPANNDTMAEAMRYLDAGDQEKARQVLASAVGRKH